MYDCTKFFSVTTTDIIETLVCNTRYYCRCTICIIILWPYHQSGYDVQMKFMSYILRTSYTLWCAVQGSSILSYVFPKLLSLFRCLILWTPCWLLFNLLLFVLTMMNNKHSHITQLAFWVMVYKIMMDLSIAPVIRKSGRK